MKTLHLIQNFILFYLFKFYFILFCLIKTRENLLNEIAKTWLQIRRSIFVVLNLNYSEKNRDFENCACVVDDLYLLFWPPKILSTEI